MARPRMRVEGAAAIALALAVSGAPAAMYKWVDEHGRVQYSDKPPADRGKSAVQMTNRGIVIKKIAPGMTPEEKKAREEELARKKEEELRAAEQRKRDHALLQSFTNVEEIDMKSDREVQSIEAMIATLRGQERSAVERLADDRRRLDSYTRRRKPPPDSMHEELRESEAQLQVIRDEIERREQEIAATRTKYQALKKRYRQLREEAQARAAAVAEPSAAPAPAGK